ncbi:MAG: division/cell wall cluster transcriptional repressor MraZ [Halanaerobiaceae bacterium]
MLMGEYQHKMDNKGRVIIPAKFRDELGDQFVATRGLDNCLFIYPMEEWGILEEKLSSLPITSKDARTFTRFFFSGATECELDKQGRMSIPINLREFAALEKQIVIIGLSSRIELWAKENWDEYLDSAEDSSDDIAAAMEELGI